MKLQEVCAQWSNWLLTFLLGKRDELVYCLKFFLPMFPIVDNETIDFVQWRLNVWKGYGTSVHRLSLLEIKMTSHVWERGKLFPSCRVPPSCCRVFLAAHWQRQDAELDGPVFWFSLAVPVVLWVLLTSVRIKHVFEHFSRKAGCSAPASLPSCLALCSKERRFLLSAWLALPHPLFFFVCLF